MTSSLNFVQPDVTLRLDLAGIIRRVELSGVLSPERADDWVGRPWEETVRGGETERVRTMVAEARTVGVSSFHQVRQRFHTGRELAIEYTTVRLGGRGGLLAVGRNLEVVAELQSRLVAAQASMARDSWKLREVETRYRLLFDSSPQPVLLVRGEELRIEEANPAATRALGVGPGSALLGEILAAEREPFSTMLARVEQQGKAPGVVVHLGSERSGWLVRASIVTAEPGVAFLLQLAPVLTDRIPVSRGSLDLPSSGPPAACAEVEQPGAPLTISAAVSGAARQDAAPARLALEPLGAAALRRIIEEKVASIERQCVEAALAQRRGPGEADDLGSSRPRLFAQASRSPLSKREATRRRKH